MRKHLISWLLIASLLISCSCTGAERVFSEEDKARVQLMIDTLNELTVAYPSGFSKQEYVYDCALGIPDDLAVNWEEYRGKPFFITGKILTGSDGTYMVLTDDGDIIYLMFQYYDPDTGKAVILEEQPSQESIRSGFFCTFWQIYNNRFIFIAGVTQIVHDSAMKFLM